MSHYRPESSFMPESMADFSVEDVGYHFRLTWSQCRATAYFSVVSSNIHTLLLVAFWSPRLTANRLLRVKWPPRRSMWQNTGVQFDVMCTSGKRKKKSRKYLFHFVDISRIGRKLQSRTTSCMLKKLIAVCAVAIGASCPLPVICL